MKTRFGLKMPRIAVFGSAIALAAAAVGWSMSPESAEAQAKLAAAPVGQAAPAFSLPDTAGKTHTLADYAGKTVVLHWQSMRCPWDVAYQPMLSKLAADYADKDVVFLAINSNYREHGPGLAAYHDAESMPYAILVDESGATAKQFGALVTPHMFVINPSGTLVYQGGIESSPRSPRDVGQSDTQYLAEVLAAVSAGETSPHTSSKPKGCGVKSRQ